MSGSRTSSCLLLLSGLLLAAKHCNAASCLAAAANCAPSHLDCRQPKNAIVTAASIVSAATQHNTTQHTAHNTTSQTSQGPCPGVTVQVLTQPPCTCHNRSDQQAGHCNHPRREYRPVKVSLATHHLQVPFEQGVDQALHVWFGSVLDVDHKCLDSDVAGPACAHNSRGSTAATVAWGSADCDDNSLSWKKLSSSAAAVDTPPLLLRQPLRSLPLAPMCVHLCFAAACAAGACPVRCSTPAHSQCHASRCPSQQTGSSPSLPA